MIVVESFDPKRTALTINDMEEIAKYLLKTGDLTVDILSLFLLTQYSQGIRDHADGIVTKSYSTALFTE